MAIEAPRFSSSNRSALRATMIEPFCLKPVACPVSASRAVQQLGGVFGELGHPPRRAQLADQPGRMPGRAAGELLALQQHHVGDAELGQVIGDRAADDAAADDDDIGAGGELGGHAGFLRGCWGGGAAHSAMASRPGTTAADAENERSTPCPAENGASGATLARRRRARELSDSARNRSDGAHAQRRRRSSNSSTKAHVPSAVKCVRTRTHPTMPWWARKAGSR